MPAHPLEYSARKVRQPRLLLALTIGVVLVWTLSAFFTVLHAHLRGSPTNGSTVYWAVGQAGLGYSSSSPPFLSPGWHAFRAPQSIFGKFFWLPVIEADQVYFPWWLVLLPLLLLLGLRTFYRRKRQA
jgi:CDP-diglyceride synthetase